MSEREKIIETMAREFKREFKRNFKQGFVEAFHEYGGWRGLAESALRMLCAVLIGTLCLSAADGAFQRGETTIATGSFIAGAYFFWRWIPRW